MDINTIKSKILVQYPLFGSILAQVKLVSDNSVLTACTDGKNIYYNPDFVAKLNESEQVFLIVHEICHIAFEHISRSKDKDYQLWNIATDAVVNALLSRDGLSLVAGSIDIKEAINFNAEEMYEYLLKEQEKIKFSKNYNKRDENPSSSDSSDDGTKQKGHDDHSIWEEVVKEMENSDNKSSEDKNISEKDSFYENTKMKKEMLEKLKEELTKTVTGHGNDSEENNRISMGDIGTAKPLIDWRRLLKDATKYTVDWSYQNAQIQHGVLVPTLEKTYEPETEILLDTSGSISYDLLRNFLRECKNIIKTSKLKVGCFDDNFYGFYEIKKVTDIENLPFQGGGYTDFDVAVDAFSKRAHNKVIFTDGYASMPSKKMDVIWVVFGENKINPEGGKVIYVDEKQLSDLYNLNIENLSKIKKL